MSAPKMFARHWIGGEWVDSEKPMESINPANGETIGTFILPDGAQLVKAFGTLGAESLASAANRSPNAQCCSTERTIRRPAEW